MLISGINYKTTTLLLDGKRIKLQLWLVKLNGIINSYFQVSLIIAKIIINHCPAEFFKIILNQVGVCLCVSLK